MGSQFPANEKALVIDPKYNRWWKNVLKHEEMYSNSKKCIQT